MFQMEILTYATFIPILFTVFLILVNDSIILPVAQARNLGVILVFLPFPHTPFLRFQSVPGICPCLTASLYPSGRISCLDLLEEPLSNLSALIFAPPKSVLTAARLIL